MNFQEVESSIEPLSLEVGKTLRFLHWWSWVIVSYPTRLNVDVNHHDRVLVVRNPVANVLPSDAW